MSLVEKLSPSLFWGLGLLMAVVALGLPALHLSKTAVALLSYGLAGTLILCAGRGGSAQEADRPPPGAAGRLEPSVSRRVPAGCYVVRRK